MTTDLPMGSTVVGIKNSTKIVTVEPVTMAKPNVTREFTSFVALLGDNSEPKSLEALEKEAITHALNFFKGNKSLSAQALGIRPKTLYNKMSRYGITIVKTIKGN
jgi:DNA-binding NtrC family response regulator